MTANYLPWLVLLAIVIASLVLKGYVKLPAFRPSQPMGLSDSPVATSPPVRCDLETYDSRTLALYFAMAARREAERDVAHQIATQAHENIKAAFSAPFSAPAPAGPATPPPASAPQ